MVFHVDQPVDQVADKYEQANPNDRAQPLGNHVDGQENDGGDTGFAPAFVKAFIDLVGQGTQIPNGHEKRCQKR